jgi:hypothetical protein
LAQQSTFLEELMAAGRGVVSLLIGDRKAGSYFDFSRRGLVGSFIALALARALAASLPMMLGPTTPGIVTRSIVFDVLLLVLEVACSAIALRQMQRLDGMVPYLVADNWATFFRTLIAAALAAAGVSDQLTAIVLVVVAILIEVNIARVVVGLSPLQIAIFLIAQLVGASIAVLLFGQIFPASDLAAQLGAAASSAAQ